MNFSPFQFSEPVLLDLKFEVNSDFKGDNCELNISTSVNVRKDTPGSDSAIVTVNMSIGKPGNEAPFFISIQEQAKFMWKAQEIEDRFGDRKDEYIENLLHKNAPALLIGYIRPIITFVTSNSPYPAYKLPFIDLTD